MKANNKKSNNFRSPLLISLGLHVILFVALIWGADFTMSEPKPTGQMVQAVVIDPQSNTKLPLLIDQIIPVFIKIRLL
jgi:colicin import membrane protein